MVNGQIIIDSNGNPVLTFYDPVTNSIVTVTADTPLPVNTVVTVQTQALKIIEEGEVTVVDAGTPVPLPSNTSAKAVIVYNNNLNGVIACVGLQQTVDALTDPANPLNPTIPPIGIPLAQSFSDSGIINVQSNSNEIWVDASVSGTKLAYHILGL